MKKLSTWRGSAVARILSTQAIYGWLSLISALLVAVDVSLKTGWEEFGKLPRVHIKVWRPNMHILEFMMFEVKVA